jgi:hypothetical protein
MDSLQESPFKRMIRDLPFSRFCSQKHVALIEGKKKESANVPGNLADVKMSYPRFLTAALVDAFPDATTLILRASLKFPDPCRDEANIFAL